ncbi:MAG TPA: hypothetical protein PKY77_13490 [Phycisphaerae bacterium]|nr:hypothetical protein [Phycisphaerae bacterium]HRY68756.1 hypothetical protein [Phycisphaerae bacterium]HSA28921.1 hypothetical protein [Phycisphaerae bacterium]
MRCRRWLVAALLGNLLGGPDAARAVSPTTAEGGKREDVVTAVPGRVDTVRHEWSDSQRRRAIPVKLYFPAQGQGPYPVIVFSHGLGGSRDGYEYLGRHWAGQGYVSVHLQHEGSDREVWSRSGEGMRALRAAAANPLNAIDRPRDVRFAIDQLVRLNREDPALKGRLDLDRIGVAGHSFGAHTALMVAGQAMVGPLGRETTFADPRVKAAIAMSAPVPARRDRLDRVYAGVTIACLHMTGTRDDSPIGETAAADRRIPFDHIRGGDQYLVTFAGADHMVFSGRRLAVGANAQDARFQELILQGSTAFWNVYLKGDRRAKAWLMQGGFEHALGKDGRLEKRTAQSTPATHPR